MIVTSLKGGLGNQMFQYAAGKALALKLNTEVLMDSTWFDNVADIDTKRSYELNCFNLNQKFVKKNSFYFRPESLSVKNKIYRHTKGILKNELSLYREKHHSFDPQMLKQKDNTYLDGFWQNEKYFKKIRPTILKDFSFTDLPNRRNQTYLTNIASSNSVSLHVRRGDYAHNKSTNTFHGLIDLNYYQAAIKKMASNIKSPHFFIFSDEIEWCKKNLQIAYPITFIDGNKKGCEDMRLMSSCSHHITANSSFSWWGAWLNPKKEKMVIAPKKWYQDPSMKNADIVPEGWMQL